MNLSLRVSTHAPPAAWLGPHETTAACVASALAENVRDLTLGALFSGRVARSLGAAASGVRVTRGELLALFASAPRTSVDVETSLALPYTRTLTGRIERVLRCTLDEPGPAAKWARPSVRAQVAVACHTDDAEQLITSVLGGFVSADARRLEELVAEVQDDADPLAVADCVLAVAGAGAGAGGGAGA